MTQIPLGERLTDPEDLRKSLTHISAHLGRLSPAEMKQNLRWLVCQTNQLLDKVPNDVFNS